MAAGSLGRSCTRLKASTRPRCCLTVAKGSGDLRPNPQRAAMQAPKVGRALHRSDGGAPDLPPHVTQASGTRREPTLGLETVGTAIWYPERENPAVAGHSLWAILGSNQ